MTQAPESTRLSEAQLPPVQWYPGHIAKAERELGELLKAADAVLEVRDARVPKASHNARLHKRLTQSKPVIVVLNKADLADVATTRRWLEHLEAEGNQAIAFSTRQDTGKYKRLLQQALAPLSETLHQKLAKQGRKPRALRLIVAGMPNVGKSSLLNTIVGKRSAEVGHKAGVTRQSRWYRLGPHEVMDTPGIIPPQLETITAGWHLAVCHGVGQATFDMETAGRFLLGELAALDAPRLATKYKLDADTRLTLETVAEAQGLCISGGAPDTIRMATRLLDDFNSGRLGSISLETP